LWELGTIGLVEKPLRSGRVRILAYFPQSPEFSTVSAVFLASCRKIGAPVEPLSTHVQEERDWLKKWRSQLRPFRAGRRFYIIPRPEVDHPIPEDRIPLWIEPRMAFGTGTHETTQLCLRSLERIQLKGKSLLDIGTGSGILAIAAIRLGARSVVACDIDPEAISVARSNSVVNGCDREIEWVTGDISKIERNRFDFVVANLTSDVIEGLLPQFASHVKPRGTLFFSGLLMDQVPYLRKAIQFHQLAILKQDRKGEWVCLTASRVA
jgi:ribosomal protein L11 methyltransferase